MSLARSSVRLWLSGRAGLCRRQDDPRSLSCFAPYTRLQRHDQLPAGIVIHLRRSLLSRPVSLAPALEGSGVVRGSRSVVFNAPIDAVTGSRCQAERTDGQTPALRGAILGPSACSAAKSPLTDRGEAFDRFLRLVRIVGRRPRYFGKD